MIWVPEGVDDYPGYHGFYAVGASGDIADRLAAFVVLPADHPLALNSKGLFLLRYLPDDMQPWIPGRGGARVEPDICRRGLPGMQEDILPWYRRDDPPAVWGGTWPIREQGVSVEGVCRPVLGRLLRAAWALGTPGQEPHDRYLAAVLRSQLWHLEKRLRRR